MSIALQGLTAIAETAPVEDCNEISIVVPKRGSLMIQRVMYVALNRLGYKVVSTSLEMETAIYSANIGENAVFASQAKGIESLFPNLIMVPASTGNVDYCVFMREGSDISIASWDDLADKSVATIKYDYAVQRKIPKTASVTQCADMDEAMAALENNVVDTLITPLPVGYRGKIRSHGFSESVIETIEAFPYVNKQYEFLVPQLSDELTKMKADGTFDEIINSSYRKDDEKNILHISSYSTQMQWEMDLIRGITEEIKGSGALYTNVELDSWRNKNTELIYKNVSQQILTKFIEHDPDVVVVSDDDALNYITKEYFSIFQDTPIVFCGINGPYEAKISPIKDVTTGAVEMIAAKDTVDLMLRLYPNTKKIFIVNDYTNTGGIWRENITKDLAGFAGRVDIEFSEDVPFGEIINKVKAFDENTLVLCGRYSTDGSGDFYNEKDVVPALSSASRLPVFSLLYAQLGHGSLGGKVTSPYAHGKKAGQMAIQIIRGSSPQDMPIDTETGDLNVWVFDESVAQFHGINPAALPFHQAINPVETILQKYPLLRQALILFSLFAFLCIVLLTIFLIRENKEKRKSDKMANTDSLTQLGNRNYFDERLKAVMAAGTKGSIVYFDLDSFKYINDVYGHRLGDACLIEVANRISTSDLGCMYPSRMGGDEFAFIVPKAGAELEKTLKGLRVLLKKPFILDNLSLHITCSIGAVEFTENITSTEVIMQNADVALFRAKSQGKNQYSIFEEYLSTQMVRQMDIMQVLHTAIESGEVQLMFQPEIDVKTNKIFAFESLCRIHSEKIGPIFPSEFIPLSENSGLIVPIGLWIFRQSCLFAQRMIEAGIEFGYVSINVSNVQFNQTDFIENIKNVIEETKIRPNKIVFEVTESVMLNDPDRVIKTLQYLKSIGISIALDDFGTGYSSLKYLTDLPIDFLKIDKSFVDDVNHNTQKREVMQLIIDTAHALGLLVVAEGVETSEQNDLIIASGCDAIQGYYYSKPLNETDFEQFMRHCYD